MIHPLPSAPRNPAIDWLRGLSILFVVVHHLALPFRLPLRHSLLGGWVPKRVLDAISFNGYESVFVFFVLSGFLIAQRTLVRDGSLRAIDWRHFYRQRAPHPAFAGVAADGAVADARARAVRLRGGRARTDLAGRTVVGCQFSAELVRRSDRVAAGRLGRAVVAVDRRNLLSGLSGGLPAVAACLAGTGAAGACCLTTVDARRLGGQRNLAGKSLSTRHVGHRGPWHGRLPWSALRGWSTCMVSAICSGRYWPMANCCY
jgi:hypothetical protein